MAKRKYERVGPILYMAGYISLLLTLVCLIMLAFQISAKAETVYVTSYRSQAKYIVYVTTNQAQANRIIWKTTNQAQAYYKDYWYFTKYQTQADITIYFTNNLAEANLIIYYK